jgi:MarR family 2-MHQ and catechol resistance regulon transcriptional repressor
MPTHYQGSPEAQLALTTYIKLARAADSVSHRINAHLADVNLTISQFGVLESLYHLGPMFQKDLAAKILKSTGNITLVIDNLAKRGLVERVRSEQDRRYIRIHLTPTGETLIADFFPQHVDVVMREFAALTPEEQKILGKLSKKLGLGVDIPSPTE